MNKPPSEDINAAELKSLRESGADFLLLDVREDFEYAMYNLGGKLIPLSSLPDHLNELEAYKNKEIVVHCRSGMRSASAKAFLLQAGFSNVRNLTGGVLAWQDAGY